MTPQVKYEIMIIEYYMSIICIHYPEDIHQYFLECDIILN